MLTEKEMGASNRAPLALTMKTQEEILTQIKANQADVHGNAMLYLFLQHSSVLQILGSRMAKNTGLTKTLLKRDPITQAWVAPMIRGVLSEALDREHGDPPQFLQEIRRDRIRALLWLLGSEKDIDWRRPLAELADVIRERTPGVDIA